MTTHRNPLAAIALVSTFALAGCFNDDDDDDPVTPPVATQVPESAFASGTSFINFIAGLSATDESSEPLTLPDGFAVPADDSSEPAPLS